MGVDVNRERRGGWYKAEKVAVAKKQSRFVYFAMGGKTSTICGQALVARATAG